MQMRGDAAGRKMRHGPDPMTVAQADDAARRKAYVGGRGGAAPIPARTRRFNRLRRGRR